MKQVLSFIFSAILALSAAEFGCAAQNYVAPPVSISGTTVERDGKVYYEHKVVEKQTLYSISKAYDVYIDEIYAANPGLKESGLKKGAVIYIPIKAAAGGTVNMTAVGTDGETAERTEDVSNVSGENTANSASLLAENPENIAVSGENTAKSGKNGANSASLENNGKASAKDRKSAKEPTEFEKNAAEKKAARIAEREKRKERKRRGISTSPEESAVEETPAPEVAEPASETPTAEADSTALDAEAAAKIRRTRPSFLGKNDICATLLLPFNATANGGNDLSMDFYSGALLAAKNLSEDSGISLYINVFDTYGDVLPDSKDLSYSDFIVGMLSKNGFGELMENVPKDCLVVSPLDTNTLPLAEDNANFYQCSNSTAAQYADIAQWLAEDMGADDKIVVIHENNFTGKEQAEEAEEALKACGLTWSEFSYSILDGRNITESLAKVMAGWTEEDGDAEEDEKKPEKVESIGVSRIIIATSNEAFANDAIRNLNVLLHSDYNIVLYGGSKIRGFDNIPVENLHNVNFHSSLSFYTDYDDPKVQKFLMEYRALFNTEPSQTAFQGYDVMYYFTIMSRRVGAMHFVERPKNTPMLMSDFEFEKCGDKGGYVRTGIRRTVYQPNYSITYLK